MRHRHSRITLQKKRRRRFADQRRPPDDHHAFARYLEVVVLHDTDQTRRSTRYERPRPVPEPPDVDRMKAVDIFVRVDGLLYGPNLER